MTQSAPNLTESIDNAAKSRRQHRTRRRHELLDPAHRSRASRAYLRHEALKSWTLHEPDAVPQVVTNGGDVLKVYFACAMHQTILEALALLVMDDLVRRGLANIHNGTTAETVRRQFRIHHP